MASPATVLTTVGQGVFASLLQQQQLMMAWGDLVTTTPWTSSQTPPLAAQSMTGLEAELGRVTLGTQAFVNPDPAGVIQDEAGNTYSLSANGGTTPTPYLYLSFTFAASANPTSTIYQVGTFYGTVLVGNMAQFTCQVANSGGYIAGTTTLAVGNLNGPLANLLPAGPVPAGWGVAITLDSVNYNVCNVNSAAGTITISPGLLGPANNGDAIIAPATSAVPGGTLFVQPSQIINPGSLILVRNIPPIIRDAATRCQFEQILLL
jgi:hypothetical protein